MTQTQVVNVKYNKLSYRYQEIIFLEVEVAQDEALKNDSPFLRRTC